MSLLMEALRKAERAKQEKIAASVSQVSLPEGAVEAAPSSSGPGAWPSLIVHEEVVAPTTTGSDGVLSHASMLREPSFSIPDLLPLPIEEPRVAPLRVEPVLPVPGFSLADSFPPEAVPATPVEIGAPRIEPERPLPPAEAISDAGTPSSSRFGAYPKASPPDEQKVTLAQQKARAVFSAKQPARSRAVLLSGAVAVIALSLGGFAYYYWQITSVDTLFLPASIPSPGNAAVVVDTAPQQQQTVPVASTLALIEQIAPTALPPKPPVVPAVHEPARAETRSAVRNEARSDSSIIQESPAIQIRQNAATSQVNPLLGKAYQSFVSGDAGSAQQLYRQVLQRDANSRDALLGLAAIALSQQQAEQAVTYYSKLLELDPADPDALPALIGLQGQTDPVKSESRLKKLLTQNPQADAAHFALGNLYAKQSRWAEAQQSFFRAYSSVPSNADYAFNLAVSLDQLNQGKLALDYYQRSLAQPGPASFDKSVVRTRVNELSQALGN